MPKTRRNSIPLWPLAMLLVFLPLLTGCAPRVVTVIPADRMLIKLDSGNYEVTPAWLQDRYRTERWLREQLDQCKGASK